MNGQRPDITGLRQDLNEVDAGIVRLIAERHDIIDAIRWVMGESSAKQLRGASMADVIITDNNSSTSFSSCSVAGMGFLLR